ncbi:MAG: hypothetical protein HFACDABA_03037 [Anaerolineales bacterium]|nr:hypothetical protein [Anaerolineales bacterium]
MKNKGFLVLLSFVVFVMIVGLACMGSSTVQAPTPISQNPRPTDAPPQPTEPPQQPSNNGGPDNSGGFKTFTDQNNLYSIQVPSDWTYEQVTGDHYYIDQFKSPDELALVENIVYNDGEQFTGSQHGKFALDLLNRFYSNTGAVGDIRVTGDQIQPDGSERLEWTSKAGGYSGFSYFEVRKPALLNFLMITIEWSDSAKDQYFDTLSQIIQSYTIP